MSNSITTTGTGLWRILVLDRDPQDPKWVLCTVMLTSDVRGATLDRAGRYRDWQAAAEWVAASVGRKVELAPVTDALCWHIREGGTPR